MAWSEVLLLGGKTAQDACCVVALRRHALCRPRHQACLAATSTEAISSCPERVCEVIQSSTAHPILCFGAHPHTAAQPSPVPISTRCVCVVDFGSTPALALCFGHQAWCCSPVAALCTVTNIGRPPVTSLPAAAAVAVRRVAARRGVRGDFPGLWRHSSARQCLRTSSVERLSTRTSPSRLARALVVLLLLEPQRHSSRHRQSL